MEGGETACRLAQTLTETKAENKSLQGAGTEEQGLWIIDNNLFI